MKKKNTNTMNHARLLTYTTDPCNSYSYSYSGEGLAPDVAVPLPEDTQVTFFRGRTSDEISADADVAAAIEELQIRLTRN